MMSFEPLWITLVKQKKKKSDLYHIASPATVARMGKDGYVNLGVIDHICDFLNCPITDVVEYRPGPGQEQKENPED